MELLEVVIEINFSKLNVRFAVILHLMTSHLHQAELSVFNENGFAHIPFSNQRATYSF